MSNFPYQTADAFPHDLQLLLARVYLRTQQRAAWLQFLLEEPSQDETATSYDPQDNPVAEHAWRASNIPSLVEQIAEVEAAISELDPETSRWAKLRSSFSFTSVDEDILQTCVAVALEPSISSYFGFLHQHIEHPCVTQPLVARLFDYGYTMHWSTTSALRLWHLVEEVKHEPWSPSILRPSRQICSWLQGHDELDEALVGIARSLVPKEPLSNWPVDDLVHTIFARLGQERPARVCVELIGLPGSGRRTLAACISERLGLHSLYLDTAHLETRNWEYIAIQAQLQARLTDCSLVWDNKVLVQRRWPSLPMYPVQFVLAEPSDPPTMLPSTAHIQVEVPPLDIAERRRLWSELLPVCQDWPEEALTNMVTQHRVTVGEIVTAARQGATTPREAMEIVRLKQRERLGTLTQRLPCPFVWEDLVVEAFVQEALQDLVFEAKERTTLWEEAQANRLFPRGQGLIALLSGPPGTGKTMAAQIIASTLELELYRIDLSTVVSKYIGETSKNLERILSQASQMDVVLLFDEADALFGKRTEVKDSHDRFANMDVNYLLQAMESYEGLALLATNKGEQLDPAMIRRLRYILNFPPPSQQQRLRIWQRLTEELAGEEQSQQLQPCLIRLAQDFKMTGAQIKASLLTAMFASRRDKQPIQAKHLLHGVHRELSKEGRPLTPNQIRSYQ